MSSKSPDKDDVDIYKYHDYRDFLRDYLKNLKSESKISMRGLAKISSISVSNLSMILKGSRKLNEKQMAKILPSLNLSPACQSYLKLLRIISDSESHEERMKALKKIHRFRSYRKLHPLEMETLEYFTNWHYMAIRELANTADFELDVLKIRKRLRYKVSPKEIRSAIDFLQKNGFLSNDSSEENTANDQLVQCDRNVYKNAFGQMHKQLLNLAIDSIYEVPSEQRNLIAHICPTDTDKLEKAKEIMERARSEITELFKDTKESDEVYSFSFLAFPLTGQSSGGGSQ